MGSKAGISLHQRDSRGGLRKVHWSTATIRFVQNESGVKLSSTLHVVAIFAVIGASKVANCSLALISLRTVCSRLCRTPCCRW